MYFQCSYLPSRVYGVVPSHECGPGGRADGLDVGGLQNEAVGGQRTQVGGEDVGVVPGHVIVT